MSDNTHFPWDVNALTKGSDLNAAWKAAVKSGLFPIALNGKVPAEGKGWNELTLPLPNLPEGRTNFGLVCGRGLVGIDVDVEDAAISDKILASLRRQLGGDIAVRYGKGQKFVVPVLAQSVSFDVTVGATDYTVQALGVGKQFVARGVHPDTGKQYDWSKGGSLLAKVSDVESVINAAIRDAGHEPRRGTTSSASVESTEHLDAVKDRVDLSVMQQRVEAAKGRIREIAAEAPGTQRGTRIHSEAFANAPAFYWTGEDVEAFADTLDDDVQRDFVRGIKNGTHCLDHSLIPGVAPQSLLEAAKAAGAVGAGFTSALLTLADLKRRPPPSWLVDGWITKRGIGMFYGSSGHGKSFLTLDLALHIAYGMPSWHGIELPGEKRAVVIIAGEGVDGLKNRTEAWQEAYGKLDEDAPLYIYDKGVDFADEASFNALLGHMDVAGLKGQVALTVVDTVSNALAGKNMVEAGETTMFMSRLKQLREFGDGAAFGVHHTKKDKPEDMYGSGYFYNDSDFVYCVRKNEDDITKGGTVYCKKLKDGASGSGWGYDVTYRKVGHALVPTVGRTDAAEQREAASEKQNWAPEAVRAAFVGAIRSNGQEFRPAGETVAQVGIPHKDGMEILGNAGYGGNSDTEKKRRRRFLRSIGIEYAEGGGKWYYDTKKEGTNQGTFGVAVPSLCPLPLSPSVPSGVPSGPERIQ